MKKSVKGLIPPDASVLFATFSLWADGKRMPTNGSVEPLRDFLVPRVKRLVLLDQLVPGEQDVSYKIEEFRNGDSHGVSHKPGFWFHLMKPLLLMTNRNSTQVTFKIRDFLSVIDWALRDADTYEYFIGLESINALAGILLRTFGKVKKVVYYVSDYSPNRYQSRIFNLLYIKLDQFVCKHTDYIWDVSKAMMPARIDVGLDPVQSAPVLHVPNGLLSGQIRMGRDEDIIPYSIGYMGTLGDENGPDLILRLLPKIIKKYPKTTYHVIGGGINGLDRLKRLAAEMRLDGHVKFYGYIPSGEKMSEYLRHCYVSVAPYRSIPGSVRYYADAGKIRAYCAAGIPVVSSKVPPLGFEVEMAGGAIIVDDNESDMANAIMRLFNDRRLHDRMRKDAFRYAKNCNWTTIFTRTFSKMN